MCNFTPIDFCGEALPNPSNPNFGMDTSGYVWTSPPKIEITVSSPEGTTIYDLGDLPVSADVCTTGVEIPQNGTGRLQYCLDGVDGDVIAQLQASFDGVKWLPFNEQSGFKLDGDYMVILGAMSSKYYRVCVIESNDCHTATTGTLKISILVNNE
jgi:hypothetical protein